MPDESVMIKAKGETSGDRDFQTARQTLYKRRDDSSDDEEDDNIDQSQSLLDGNIDKNEKRNKVK